MHCNSMGMPGSWGLEKGSVAAFGRIFIALLQLAEHPQVRKLEVGLKCHNEPMTLFTQTMSHSGACLMVKEVGSLPAETLAAVLKPSEELPEGSLTVRGYDFDCGLDYRALLQSYLTTGFQATSFGQAVIEVNRMVS